MLRAAVAYVRLKVNQKNCNENQYVLYYAGKMTYADGASEEATWLTLHSSGGAIQRALSCDSVISEASVTELDYVTNKIGQLEFSVQYVRYVSSSS